MSLTSSLKPLEPLADLHPQLMFIGNIFYVCAITFIKLSIIVSYLRIFPYNTLRLSMYLTAAVTVGLFIASVPATIFQCSPVSAAWDLTIDNADSKCFTFINFLYASTAINVTTDLVLCTAPLPYFWNLQLPKKQKIIVSSLFFIGGLYVPLTPSILRRYLSKQKLTRPPVHASQASSASPSCISSSTPSTSPGTSPPRCCGQ